MSSKSKQAARDRMAEILLYNNIQNTGPYSGQVGPEDPRAGDNVMYNGPGFHQPPPKRQLPAFNQDLPVPNFEAVPRNYPDMQPGVVSPYAGAYEEATPLYGEPYEHLGRRR